MTRYPDPEPWPEHEPIDPNADTDLPADSGASLGEIVKEEEQADLDDAEGKDCHP